MDIFSKKSYRNCKKLKATTLAALILVSNINTVKLDFISNPPYNHQVLGCKLCTECTISCLF